MVESHSTDESIEMSAIDSALNLIKEFEGCALRSYQDKGGTWTIGWGCTHAPIASGMTIDQSEADRRLEMDTQDTMIRVKAQISVPLTDNQLAALICFTYNEGAGHLMESTVEKLLNSGDYAGAADALLMWDKCRGVVVPGLLRRRQAERSLFLTDSSS